MIRENNSVQPMKSGTLAKADEQELAHQKSGFHLITTLSATKERFPIPAGTTPSWML